MSGNQTVEKDTVLLNGMDVSIEDIVKIARFGHPAAVGADAMKAVRQSRRAVDTIVEKEIRTYGINTGFGKLSTVSISKEDIRQLQKNLIMSHATGIGKPLSTEAVRAMMALRVNALAKGVSGISEETLETLVAMLNSYVHPVVPERGSVGASGDLCPLAHMVLPMLGEGEAEFQGVVLPGAEAMKRAGVPVIALGAKEGLALINGTCAMMAAGTLAAYDAMAATKMADIIAALSLEALEGVIDAFDERIQLARPHKGQIACAENVRNLTDGSTMVTRQGEKRIQDAYSLRCIPAVHGGSREALRYVVEVMTTEINAATDNPLIFCEGEEWEALSGCNFHGQPVAVAMDTLGIAMAELANISERRLERLINPALNNDLPAFLSRDTGLNSGFMQVQFPAAATVSENKVLAHPASVDSIPTSGNQEDHVSMGTIAARKAFTITEYAMEVLGLELFCAAQAADFRGKERLGKGTRTAYDLVREHTPFITEDVILYPRMEACIRLVKQGTLLGAVEEKVALR